MLITRSRILRSLTAFLKYFLAAGVCFTAFIKLYHLETHSTLHMTPRISYFTYMALKHDAAIFSAVLFLLFLSDQFRHLAVRLLLRLTIFATLFLYALDVAVLRMFSKRITFEDIVKFYDETPTYIVIAFQKDFFTGWAVVYGTCWVILICAALYVLFEPYKRRARSKIFAGLAGVFLLFYLVPETGTYVHPWLYKNVFEFNSRRGINREYSAEFKNNTLQQHQDNIPATVCRDNPTPQRPNIIVVLIESLSMYHSRYFSGLEDFTPNLDRIAQENTALVNFYSNGFATDDALYAMMLGSTHIPAARQYSQEVGFAFRNLYDRDNTLPGRLHQAGYTTEFLTTGYLTFLNKDSWLRGIGFDYLEGHDHPFYDNWPRFAFKAAPDAALYERALARIQEIDHDTPFFMVLETVTTHQPYYDPTSGQQSEEAAFRYADRQLGKLYDHLKANGFFKNGILVVLSDQHTMAPLRKDELERFGESAYARIPAVVVRGDTTARRVEEPFQQADLYSSIVNLTSPRQCTSFFNGDFLSGPPQPPECILYVRGDDRDLISAYCRNGSGRIRLNGDATGVVSGNLSEADAGIVVDQVNSRRIKAENNKLLIAHALGGIDGAVYTNSREAFLKNYAEGKRWFEVDLLQLADGSLVGFHEGHDRHLGLEPGDAAKLSKDEFLRLQYDGYTVMTFQDLLQLAQEREDVYLVTDTKFWTEDLMEALAADIRAVDPALRQRIVPQFYKTDDLELIRKAEQQDGAFASLIFTLYTSPLTNRQVFEFARDNSIPYVTMPVIRTQSKDKFIEALHDLGTSILVHTINDPQEVEALKKKGVDGFYTDTYFQGSKR